MREKREYVVITFATTTSALAMESICALEGIPGRIIPTPREITAGCGLAWRILSEDYDTYKSHLMELNINFEGITRLYL